MKIFLIAFSCLFILFDLLAVLVAMCISGKGERK